MDFEQMVSSIVERSRTSNDAAAGMAAIAAKIKGEYDPAKRRELETTERAYQIAAMRLLQSAELDRLSVEKQEWLDRAGWGNRQPQPRP